MNTELPAACAACPVKPLETSSLFQRHGAQSTGARYTVALAGNPNTGKSTVFNALTGLRQHVGNWAGKTVERAEGGFTYEHIDYKLVDLPGTYSLLSTSVDEEIARDFILFGKPDVTVVVVDAARLERNLNLVLQVLEITSRVVVALNLVDEARRHGIAVDARHLSRELGVQVIPTVARRGQGLQELLAAIAQVASGAYVSRPYRIQQRDPRLESAVQEVARVIESQYPNLPNARWVALRLIEGDESIEEAVRQHKLGELTVWSPPVLTERHELVEAIAS
ncbi:MAG TPA: FeoB small GTPase domain-containing protein [Candidatus Limnocylindrales bacterium]|nr:FeoB small GTPase domain-containing protein [Candidatus Limnocylindrales bacterium]